MYFVISLRLRHLRLYFSILGYLFETCNISRARETVALYNIKCLKSNTKGCKLPWFYPECL